MTTPIESAPGATETTSGARTTDESEGGGCVLPRGEATITGSEDDVVLPSGPGSTVTAKMAYAPLDGPLEGSVGIPRREVSALSQGGKLPRRYDGGSASPGSAT